MGFWDDVLEKIGVKKKPAKPAKPTLKSENK